MAAYSVTVSSSLSPLGLTPPDLWEDYLWAGFVWGVGTAPFQRVVVLSSDLSPTGEPEHLYLREPNGFLHVFPEAVTDFTLSTLPSWAAAASPSLPVNWSTLTVSPSIWG